jgi:hypothetical protein
MPNFEEKCYCFAPGMEKATKNPVFYSVMNATRNGRKENGKGSFSVLCQESFIS